MSIDEADFMLRYRKFVNQSIPKIGIGMNVFPLVEKENFSFLCFYSYRNMLVVVGKKSK